MQPLESASTRPSWSAAVCPRKKRKETTRSGGDGNVQLPRMAVHPDKLLGRPHADKEQLRRKITDGLQYRSVIHIGIAR